MVKKITKNSEVTSEPNVVVDDGISLGQMLSQQRARSGHSIQQLSMTTRIAPEFIKALEEDRLKDLPGAVFARGFVRNLCRALGAPDARFMEKLSRTLGQTSSAHVSLEPQAKADVASVKLKSERHNWRRQLGDHSRTLKTIVWRRELLLAGASVGGIILLVGGAIKVYRRPALLHSSSVTKVEDQPVELAPVEVAKLPNEAVATIPDRAITEPPVTAKNDDQLVEVTVKSPVRIKMNLDNNQAIQNQLTPDTYQFRFKQKAQMMIYDASAVSVSFNGRALGDLGRKGRIRRLSFVAGEPEPVTKP